MVIAAGAVKEFTDHCNAATGAAVEPSLSETLIRQIRSIIGNKVLGAATQHTVVVSSLIVLKGALLEHSSQIRGAWTFEDWAEVLWTLLEASIARTRSATSVDNLLSSDSLWLAAVSTALDEVREDRHHSHPIWWSGKPFIVAALVLLALFLGAVASYVPVAAKFKFLALCVASGLVAFALGFCMRGPAHLLNNTLVEDQIVSERVEVSQTSAAPSSSASPQQVPPLLLRQNMP